jgi:hypothetical protein
MSNETPKDYFKFYYSDNKGFQVQSEYQTDCPYHPKIAYEFLKLLRAAGFDYLTGITLHSELKDSYVSYDLDPAIADDDSF